MIDHAADAASSVTHFAAVQQSRPLSNPALSMSARRWCMKQPKAPSRCRQTAPPFNPAPPGTRPPPAWRMARTTDLGRPHHGNSGSGAAAPPQTAALDTDLRQDHGIGQRGDSKAARVAGRGLLSRSLRRCCARAPLCCGLEPETQIEIARSRHSGASRNTAMKRESALSHPATADGKRKKAGFPPLCMVLSRG